MNIEFARSLSGHDKEQIYLIKEADEDAIYLVNGENRTLDRPKKKNRKHIQMIKKLPAEVTDCFSAGVTDLTVKRAVRLYSKLYQ